MPDPRKIFGDLLRATRVAKGYSLRKFAEMESILGQFQSQSAYLDNAIATLGNNFNQIIKNGRNS